MIKQVALVAVAQLALVGVAVAPQLSARFTGEEYRLRVAPVDPIDPFRGAYVDLDYPDLHGSERQGKGAIYLTLVEQDDVWVEGDFSRTRPDEGPYLACDDRGWELRCGIESWFASQSEAKRLEAEVADEGMIAVVKVDGRGHATLVGLEPR